MSKPAGHIMGGEVNAVLRLVNTLRSDGDGQLTILTMALVIALKSCRVDRETAITVIGEEFDKKHELIDLAETVARLS